MNVEMEIRKYIIGKFLLGDASRLSDHESLFESGAIDSLGILELVAFIEQKFGIRIEDEELIPENFETVYSLTDLIEGKLALQRKPQESLK